MKKLLLLPVLFLLAFALVSCGGEKVPPVTELPVEASQPATETNAPVTTSAPITYTVRFMDAEIFKDENGEQILLSERSVQKGKFARAPKNPFHDGYVFIGWDVDDFSSITADTVITAQYRKLDMYTVEFYDDTGKLISSVKVEEEGAADLPQRPLKPGFVFTGWDKAVDRVNRDWADFEAYKELSDEELADTKMIFKTAAVYEEAERTIPFVENITFELKEEKKEGSTVYVPAEADKFSAAFIYTEFDPKKHYAGKGVEVADKYNKVKAKTSYAWDGEFIYGYAVVEDETLLSRGVDYCTGQKDPWQNDAFEYYYSLGKPISANYQCFTVDLYGHRLGGIDGSEGNYRSMSNFFEQIECEVKVVEETNTSYIFFKLPAKAEDGKALQTGDVVYSAIQLDDIRDLNIVDRDLPNIYCTTSNRSNYEQGYERYTLGAKE